MYSKIHRFCYKTCVY